MSASYRTRSAARCRVVITLIAGFCLLVPVSALAQGGPPPVVDTGQPDLAARVRVVPLGGSIRLENLFLDQFGSVALELGRFRVFAEDAQIVRGASSNRPPRNVYLRGPIEGFPGSLAVLGFRERGTIGGLILVAGDYWEVTGRAGVGGLVSRKLDPGAAEKPYECLADALPGSRGAASSSVVKGGGAEAEGAPTYSYTARVALETDWEFLDLFAGDQAAATDYVGDLFAFASSIYEAEIDTSLYVSYLNFWPGTASDDPWTAGDCTNQLFEYRDYWNANNTGIERTIGHMLSGKRTGCGIAYVGVLCSSTVGYGVSASLNANFDPANPVPPVWDIIVVSHEIGHNFNSPHTHCYDGIPDGSFPDPVDPCYTAGGCYSGPTDLPAGCPGPGQGCGTIMSYCHLRSGGYGNIGLTFGGSVLDGSSHLYGIFPERVPERMYAHVLSRAGSGCLDPVAAGSTLSITKAGTGTGTVTSDDAGIDCGSDCSETYPEGSSPTVTLTATADAGSSFIAWSGDADCDDGQVTMGSNIACTATFDLDALPQHTLTVAKAGTGSGTVTSTPAGIDCGADCTEDYDEGSAVTLTGSPDAGSVFAGWSGDADCSDGSVTMDAARSCTATFDPEPPPMHTLTVTKAGAGTGTVTSTPAGIDCGADCSEAYDPGTAVTLTATPDAGSLFAGWSGDADCSDGAVTMDAAKTCTATFDSGRVLTITKAGSGSGTVTTNPAGIDCGATCQATFSQGATVQLLAVPDPGSIFVAWSGASDCTDGEVRMNQDRACTATFDLAPPPNHTLTVSKTGNGSGTVTSAPGGIDCGADCSEDYNEGTVVTLSAAADTGSTFVGWSGDADCSDGSVTMMAATSCTATFTLDTYTLSVSKVGTGSGTVTSSPTGIDCGVDCNESYDYGTVVTLTATAGPGSTFAGWSGNADCTDGSVTIDATTSCTATFTLDTYSLTVSKAGTGSGTVTSSPAGIDCGADCSETYDYNTVVNLTPGADVGSTFTGWSGDADCSDGSVTMTVATSCTATFTLDTYTLSAAKEGTGSGTVTSTPAGIDCGADCSDSYDYGTVVTLTPTADGGSTFAGWSGDADCSDGSVTMDAAKSCTATFTLDTYTLTIARAGTGSGTVTSSPAGIDCGADCSEAYDYNTVVTLTPATDPGSNFAGWSGDADCSDGSVTMTAARSCTATFTLDTHTLTVAKAGTGSGTVTSSPAGIDCGADCSEAYDYNTVVNLTPAADAGSTFAGWSGDADCSDGSVTMTAATSCTATFTLDTHTLTVSKAGTGSGTVTSSPAGIDCGVDCSEAYDYNTVVGLTPTADAGSTFAGWSGDADCSDGSVTMDTATSCTATFTLDTYTLSVSKAGIGSGTVTSTPAGIDCGADCSETYDYGTVVTLSPAPAADSSFEGWSGDADCTDGQVTVTQGLSCTATFDLLPPQTYPLTVSRAGSGAGTVTSSPAGIDCGVDCNETYTEDTVVTLTATPQAGSTFAGWSGDADCSDGSVTMTAARSCTATFTLDTYTLSVNKAGTGSGTVTSTPAGIDCGADCSQDYDYNTAVSLTAAADPGSTFTGWSGDADCSDGSVTMSAARSCTATFALDTHTLTVAKAGTGSGTVTSSPAGIDCGVDCNETYTEDTVVTLTATPQTGSTFASWSGDADCSDGSVTMTGATSCTATFTVDAYSLTVSKAGTGSGTVTSAPAGIDCGVDCSQDYDYNTVVDLTPAADPGSTFTGWSGDADCSDGSVTMTAARSCTATFTLDTYTLSVNKAGTGSGTVTSSPAGVDCGADCSQDYGYNTVVSLTPAPDAGSTFAGWSGDADCSDGSVTMTAATSCTATFTLDTYTLSVSKAGTGTGTVTSSPAGIDCGADCSEAYDYGAVVTLTPAPATDSSFEGWSGDADCADGQVTVTQNLSCTATFDLLPPQTYPLTVTKAGSGAGTVTSSPAGIDCGVDCNETYTDGTLVTLTASPQTGSTFAGWSGDTDCSDGSVTMDAAKSCTATFTLDMHTLTVSKAGTGSGTVTSSPVGIDCGADCSESYDYDTVVSLTPTADPGSTFAGWSGDADCSDGSVTMTAATSCTATFTLDTYTLSVSKAGTGTGTVTSSPAGIDCGADCAETYDYGTVVTLTPAPATDSSFEGWSGDADCADGQVTVTQDLSCTATFDLLPPDTFGLTISKAGSGAGTVTSTPAGIDCGADCGETYTDGTVVTLTGTPQTGSTFAGWSGDADCSDGSVTMTAPTSCTATFTLDTYTLTVAKAGTGGGTVTSSPAGIDCGADCSETYDYGTVVTLIPAPAADSSFEGWSGDADCADGQVTVTQGLSCTATFDLLPPDTFGLTISKAGSGAGTVTSTPAGIDCGADCGETYTDGTVVTLTGTPQTGSTFAGWSGDVDCSDGSVTMTAPTSCTATFTLDTYTLTVAKAGTGGGTVTSSPAGIDCGADCSETYDYGTVVTLIPAPAADSSFEGWSGDADCADGQVTVTQGLSCTATFDLLPPDTFGLTISKSGSGTGTVTSTPAGIDCGADCNETYTEDTVVTLTATPQTGSTFAGWSGDADCSDGSVTMNAAKSCTATFDSAKVLTVSLAGAGTGTVTSIPAGIDCGAVCQASYSHGTLVQLVAVAGPGSVFNGWSGEADCADAEVRMNRDRDCTATFDLAPPSTYTLTVATTGSGSGTVTSTPAGIDCGSDCSEVYGDGTVVTLTASTDPGSVFSGWSGDADCSDGSVTMSATKSCTAQFELPGPGIFADGFESGDRSRWSSSSPN